MITLDNLLWCGLVMACLLAAWGLVWWLGRERRPDWDAPARDLDETDAAYADVRSALYGHRRNGWAQFNNRKREGL